MQRTPARMRDCTVASARFAQAMLYNRAELNIGMNTGAVDRCGLLVCGRRRLGDKGRFVDIGRPRLSTGHQAQRPTRLP